MIFAVSMMSGVDHDRVEGAREAIVPRMIEMLNMTEDEVASLLLDASVTGTLVYYATDVRALIKQIH